MESYCEPGGGLDGRLFFLPSLLLLRGASSFVMARLYGDFHVSLRAGIV